MKVFDIDQTLIPSLEFYAKENISDCMKPNLNANDLYQVFETEESFKLFAKNINEIRFKALQSNVVYRPIGNHTTEKIILISDFFPTSDIITLLEHTFNVRIVGFFYDIKSLESYVDNYILYDDSPKRIEETTKAKQIYIVDQPWNRHLQIGQRIKPFYSL